MDTEVKNKEGMFGETHQNADGSPVQEVEKDGETVAEIRNKEGMFGETHKNADGSPVKEVTPT